MPLPLAALAAAAAGAGLPASPEYRAYRACLERAVQAAARDEVTPEDMPVQLRAACPDERTALSDLIRRGTPAAGDAAALNARRLEAATGAMLGDLLRRYTVHYATGLWPGP